MFLTSFPPQDGQPSLEVYSRLSGHHLASDPNLWRFEARAAAASGERGRGRVRPPHPFPQMNPVTLAALRECLQTLAHIGSLAHYLCSHDQQHLAGLQWLLGKLAASRVVPQG